MRSFVPTLFGSTEIGFTMRASFSLIGRNVPNANLCVHERDVLVVRCVVAKVQMHRILNNLQTGATQDPVQHSAFGADRLPPHCSVCPAYSCSIFTRFAFSRSLVNLL